MCLAYESLCAQWISIRIDLSFPSLICWFWLHSSTFVPFFLNTHIQWKQQKKPPQFSPKCHGRLLTFFSSSSFLPSFLPSDRNWMRTMNVLLKVRGVWRIISSILYSDKYFQSEHAREPFKVTLETSLRIWKYQKHIVNV